MDHRAHQSKIMQLMPIPDTNLTQISVAVSVELGHWLPKLLFFKMPFKTAEAFHGCSVNHICLTDDNK